MQQTPKLLLLFLILLVAISPQSQSTQSITLGTQKTFKLATGDPPFIGSYLLSLTDKDLPKNQDKWYLFAMAQPNTQNKQLIGIPHKIKIQKIDKRTNLYKPIKQCLLVQQTDACFIKNIDFDYRSQNIHYQISCHDKCQFNLISQIDYSYPLQLNKPIDLNFQNTAYSKIFTINTQGYDFYQLRILLLPKGFIKYSQPIILLANFGQQIPSRQSHDLQAIHTWDDGQGLFIRKLEMNKSRIVTLLIQGPEKNILTLSVSTYQKLSKIQLSPNTPTFDLLKFGQNRSFVAAINKNVTHRIKVVVFTGGISFVNVFKVQQNTDVQTPLNYSQPIQKYGQFEYRISNLLIQKQRIKKILIRINVLKQTTYLVNYHPQQQQITLLFPYISQTSYMQPSQIDQYYFKIQQLIQLARYKKSSNIQIIFNNINGDIKCRFYKCNIYKKQDTNYVQNCQLNANNRKDFTEIYPFSFQNKYWEKRYWFEIQWLDFVKKSTQDTTEIVYQMVVVVENILPNTPSSYQIQYKNKDRIYLLRQGQTTKDRVSIQQKRHYKLSIQDSDATQVRIHCTKISGQIIFFGIMTDPRTNQTHQQILPIYGIVNYPLNTTKKVNQIFLQVVGIDNSLYSITVQIIRKSQSSKKNGTGYNQLIITQQIPYQFIINSQDSLVLQLHLQQREFTIHLKSTLALQVCMTENLASPPYPPNCQIRNDSVLQLDQRLFMDKGLIGNIGLKNNNSNNVTVHIRISTPNPKNTTQKCQLAPMNQITWKRSGTTQNPTDQQLNYCIQFDISRYSQLQLLVDIRGQTLYSDGKITASFNNQQIIKIMSPSYIFSADQIKSSCKDKNGLNNFCSLKVKLQKITRTGILILAQYTDQAIRLMDGLAHQVHTTLKKSQPKYFYMTIVNIQDLTIFLQNKIGQYKVYASLMQYDNFTKYQSKKDQSIYPTQTTKHFQSTNPFYYSEQIITITQKQIKQKCPQNSIGINCALLISVNLDGNQQTLKNAKFVLQATQQNRQIKDGIPLTGYLQKKSVKFYHYYNSKPSTSIFITINNQNKNCLDTYIKQGSQRASISNSLIIQKATNNILIEKSILGTYSITLQANQNCQYTIQITSSNNNINRIKKGTFKDINLSKDQSIYLLFQNQINQTFKILSSNKKGEVIIYANPILPSQLQSTLLTDLSTINDWIWINKDSVRIPNVDRKNKPQSGYCFQCFYLIKVTASTPTEASIIIPTPDTQLPITIDSIFKDILLKDQSTIFRIFTQSTSQFQTHVQYGKIRIIITQSDKNTVIYNSTFQSSKNPIIKSFNLSKLQTYEYLRYSRIKIQALQQSYFSFGIISNTDPTKRNTSTLKYGIPQYLYLASNEQRCVQPQQIQPNTQFLFSFSRTQKAIISTLDIKIKQDTTQLQYIKQLGNNQMIISNIKVTQPPPSKPPLYTICFKTQQPFSLTLIQSSSINYWPQKQPIIIKKQLNLTFGSQGRCILQINQCKSRAITEIFSQFKSIKSTYSEIKQRRRNNNIIEFEYWGPVFIHLISDKATLRWFPVNETAGTGLGYDDYQTNSIRVSKTPSQLQIKALPISPLPNKKANSTIISINYTFFTAKQQMQLYSAMNCAQGQFLSKSFFINHSSITNSNQPIIINFNIIKQLNPIFSELPYFLVGLKAYVKAKPLKSPQGQYQQYRFYYPYQQIPKQMLSPNNNPVPINDDEVNQNTTGFPLYGYLLLAIVILALAYYIYKKRCSSTPKKAIINESIGLQMRYTDFPSH